MYRDRNIIKSIIYKDEIKNSYTAKNLPIPHKIGTPCFQELPEVEGCRWTWVVLLSPSCLSALSVPRFALKSDISFRVLF